MSSQKGEDGDDSSNFVLPGMLVSSVRSARDAFAALEKVDVTLRRAAIGKVEKETLESRKSK